MVRDEKYCMIVCYVVIVRCLLLYVIEKYSLTVFRLITSHTLFCIARINFHVFTALSVTIFAKS